MRMYRLLLTTAAITVLGTMSDAQDAAYQQLGQLLTITGGNDEAAFAVGPELSEELGFSLTGRGGITLTEGAAVGLIGKIGQNVTEGMINLGFAINEDLSVVATAGQLRERLVVGDTNLREWVSQNELGLAIKGDNLGINAYYIASASTENFVGAVTSGAEVEGSIDISDNATLSANLGYQRMEWDDGAVETLEEITGGVDLAIGVTDMFRFNTFADYNVSEVQTGFGASWILGAGTLDLDYTYVKMNSLSGLDDDQRLALTLSIPLSRPAAAVASRRAALPGKVTASTQNPNRGEGLLLEVMKRPDYLSERVAVLESGGCPITGITIDALSATVTGFPGPIGTTFTFIVQPEAAAYVGNFSAIDVEVDGVALALNLVGPDPLRASYQLFYDTSGLVNGQNVSIRVGCFVTSATIAVYDSI